jgi:hypothetical protein
LILSLSSLQLFSLDYYLSLSLSVVQQQGKSELLSLPSVGKSFSFSQALFLSLFASLSLYLSRLYLQKKKEKYKKEEHKEKIKERKEKERKMIFEFLNKLHL